MRWLKWDLNLRTRLIGETLFNLLFWMYFPYMTLYFRSVFGEQTAGLLMSVPPLIGIFGSLIGGHLSDRLGRRFTMLLGAFTKTGMFAIFALSLSHWTDYLAFIGISLGGALYGPASSAMVADLTPERDRRVVFATFVTAMNIGAVFGPALGAVFFFRYRSELLWTCTGVMLLYAVAVWFIVRETLPASAKAVKPAQGALSLLQAQVAGYAVIFRDRAFAVYIAAGIFVTFAFMQLDLYLAVYVKDYVPAQTLIAWEGGSFALSSMGVFGWMMGINGLLFVLGVLPVTRWMAAWSDRNVLIFSSLLFGIGMFLIGWTTNAWLLFGFTILMTIGELSRSPVAQSFVSRYAPEAARGQYMGAASLQFAVGRFLAPSTVILSAWLSPIAVFGIILLCTLISIALYIGLFRMLPAQEPGQRG
ncbi:MDR family MFS transporter [Cohnella nanjingensis]|uniref:MFS transporter n=1 Tax=Cohnella nanjingensis TaxID=1387779 RepID=A0A7X0RN69_9BACL|nr:MFS transporter [Cohnella nanjingensis]MBB6670476.1 MFS transporter [Cohnella nanjingensis]